MRVSKNACHRRSVWLFCRNSLPLISAFYCYFYLFLIFCSLMASGYDGDHIVNLTATNVANNAHEFKSPKSQQSEMVSMNRLSDQFGKQTSMQPRENYFLSANFQPTASQNSIKDVSTSATDIGVDKKSQNDESTNSQYNTRSNFLSSSQFRKIARDRRAFFTNSHSDVAKERWMHGDNLQSLYNQLGIIRPCNRTIESPLLQRLLSDAVKHLQHNISTYDLLRLTILPTHLIHFDTLVRNGEMTDSPVVFPTDSSSPSFVLKLLCRPTPRWAPVVVFPTQSANSFFQITITDYPKLNACVLSPCPSKCSYTVHNHLRIYARSCCPQSEQSDSVTLNLDESTGPLKRDQFCREDFRQLKQLFYCISTIATFLCIIVIPLIIRERLRQHETRGWSLMEPFFLGAALLYLIPLLDWYGAERNSCCVAVWMRITGFTLFYGSILLKIFRNLQEYRVRKAHHVIVREQDLLKYLIVGLLVSFLALLVWTVSAESNTELWDNTWPQCPMDGTAQMWAACELVALIYGMRLCYKARSSSWVERYQFSIAICFEAIISLIANLIRYSIRNAGSNDALFFLSVVQLHLTVSVNITVIIAPKFLFNSESSRRSLAMGSASGSGGRAHPSLAKLRDNLVNGTIDFADIPITEMNAEDIRAELKRVYMQLRMYKLKNIYQDNPHISKRKGGGKKGIEKTASKNRRISIPPPTSNNSPKIRSMEEPMIAAGGTCTTMTDDEKSDLTVESAPYNFYLSTSNKVRFLDVANEQTSMSVRV